MLINEFLCITAALHSHIISTLFENDEKYQRKFFEMEFMRVHISHCRDNERRCKITKEKKIHVKFMENANKKYGNKTQPKIAQLTKIGFYLWVEIVCVQTNSV